ncbi:MAG: OsmC family peroxiredoxin, partial [Anaerolineae bacterium]
MDAKVDWKGRMTFIGTSDSGFTVKLGADPSVGGDNDGFRPMELMAISLAGCTAMDVISILRKKRQDVTAFEVHVHTERAKEHPRVFTRAEILYRVTGHGVDEAAVVRSIELSAVRYCPAQGMLARVMPIAL